MTNIGILGAGQLGRMLALAGYPLGHRFRFLDPASDSPAGLLADHLALGYTDKSALEQFAEGLDVVTYEFENVPVEAARHLEKFVPVYPPSLALEKAQDRFVEKSFFQELGIPTPKFTIDLNSSFSFPAVLKTRRMGYDGKGQSIVHSQAEVAAEKAVDCILEEFVSFDRELSIIAVRNKSGETKFYPLIENHHRDGILRLSLVIGNVSAELQKQAEEYATRVMSALNYVGVLTIEFFEKDGQLLANEMAPRVHNSGHWTIEGAITSQFENQVRAVCDAPLGSTNPLGVCAMVNLVGTLPDETSILKIEGAHLHLYDKAPRPKRKLGHITLVEKDVATLNEKLDEIRKLYAEF
ncbi:5-(carboxyamino)imidazole ribonucleotide synthase [Candidatus Villigracilis affinis]|uniref:5-(carboxyamino)imidazole ribonucleotide synthase n=1 Tax=Candidatus Villigracilis affinis TaxID=3140682 RepID=UPI002A19C64B|nr:5-(carboxyamino)imidazole ribonucleotide synthase [Anaerolineales bacterium]